MKQKLFIALSVILLSFVIIWACKEEELPEFSGINKVELTITADSTSYVFSEINCTLNQKPKFTVEQHGFCWDTLANVTIEKQKSNNGSLNTQSFDETIENLLPNKTYYVKAYVQNQEAIIYSNELTINTLDAKPIVTTNDITNILANSAQSGGNANAYETLFPITQRGVCWGKTQNPTIADSLTLNGTGNGTFVSNMQNLEIGETYFVRAYAINSKGITYGNEKTFSTLDGVPELTSDSISNITATSATFYGNIIENDGLAILEKGFCWSTNTNPTIANSFKIVTGNNLGSFNTAITGLAINTTFYCKAYIKNTQGTFYGNEISFTTENGLPTVTTTSISNITAISASSGGNITDDGGFPVTTRGVCWSTASNPTILDNHTTDGSGSGNFLSNFSDLEVSTTYYIRAYATNINGTAYGIVYNFTTEDGLPTLTTTVISNITETTSESGGNITDDGGFPITARGVCWSTITNPTVADDTTKNGIGIGTYTSSLTGLDVNTKYYVRSYATNGVGTSYGIEVSFTTLLSIGNIYQGGKVAYILQPNDPCYIAGEIHGLIAAPSDQSSGAIWGCYGTEIYGADGTALCTGNQNTLEIVAGCSSAGIAARLCSDLVLGGYSDWYLPSKDELKKLFLNRAAIGGFTAVYYWSSSEYGNSLAWINAFDAGGVQDYSSKNSSYYVRAVRVF